MREKQNNWQRIEAVIKWANMSTNYFARHIGLARGENLYQIKRGNNGISLDVADRIVFMDGGFIVEEGPAAQVIDNPQHQRTKSFLSNYAEG